MLETPPSNRGTDDARGPTTVIACWSTDLVPQRQRLEYWVDTISEALFAMSTSTSDPARFQCRMSIASMDGLAVALAQGSNQVSFRTRRFVSRSAEHSYHLVGDFTQPWVLCWRGQYVKLLPGDLVLTDSSQIHGGLFPDSCRVVNVRLPPEWLLCWVREPASLVGRRIDGRTGWGAALSAFVAQLSPESVVSTAVARRSISDHVGGLLSMVEAHAQGWGSHAKLRETARRQNLERVLNVVRQRAMEPGLEAQDVAESLDVPISTLLDWLVDAGEVFGSLLQSERISMASDMLSSRQFDGVSTAAIGRQVGVLDSSHFAKLVRRHLGESPLAHRRASRD